MLRGKKLEYESPFILWVLRGISQRALESLDPFSLAPVCTLV